jgi:lysophospholipid acyltransferase (LPLAT)-like uncharacterized protein
MSETQPSLSPPKRRGGTSRFFRLFDSSTWLPATIAAVATWYMKLVYATSRVTYEPENPFILHRAALPGIGTLWHGNQFLLAPIRPPAVPVRILVSNHRDGEITARVARNFGAETVRGSGGGGGSKRWLSKGGVRGFLALCASLEEGYSVILTADSTLGKARRAGEGVIALARTSGRAIVGIGITAKPRIVFNSWDRTVLPLPFCRIAVVATTPVIVPADASDAVMEEKRRELEDALNAATERAYQIADRRAG